MAVKISNFPCDYKGSEPYVLQIPQTAFKIPSGLMESYIYVYAGQGVRGKAHCLISVSANVEVRLTIGGATSPGSGLFAPGSGTWSPEVSLTISGTGWQTIYWEIRSDYVLPTGKTCTIQGHCVNQE